MRLLTIGALLVASAAANGIDAFGPTFGNGLAGIPICGSSKPPSIVINYTLPEGATHGVLHHFWATGAREKIDRFWVDYHIDGETSPSISFQPSMMCGVAFPDSLPKKPTPKEFGAGSLCGKTAPVGGWFNSFPIPFYKSALVTVRANEMDGTGCFGGYLNVRGTVNLPLVLPGSSIPLPTGTRMVLQKNPMAVRQPLEYVPLAQLPKGQKGMVFFVSWAVESKPAGGAQAGGGYIEGCWQFYRTANESFPGLVVGTGVEDYFDSAYYFGADSGDGGIPFQTAFNGLTVFERTTDGFERISAYRFHNKDPLVMADGGKLQWRVGAKGAPGTTKCGNPLPKQGMPTFDGVHMDGYESTIDADGTTAAILEPEPRLGSGLGRQLTPINLTTYAWVYTFNPSPTPLPPVLPTPVPPTPAAPTPPPAPTPDSGCSVGYCSGGLCDLHDVRACKASWTGDKSLRMPKTKSGGACGGGKGGKVCAAPADACGDGWDICASARGSSLSSSPSGTSAQFDELANTSLPAFSTGISPAQCGSAAPGRFVGAMSHASTDHTCASGKNNGCHGGWGGEPVCCGADCVIPSCPDGVWPHQTRIYIDMVAGGTCDSMSSGSIDGVLCCRA